jgi:hypothetical protein
MATCAARCQAVPKGENNKILSTFINRPFFFKKNNNKKLFQQIFDAYFVREQNANQLSWL